MIYLPFSHFVFITPMLPFGGENTQAFDPVNDGF
jgi:hypothetical protein